MAFLENITRCIHKSMQIQIFLTLSMVFHGRRNSMEFLIAQLKCLFPKALLISFIASITDLWIWILGERNRHIQGSIQIPRLAHWIPTVTLFSWLLDQAKFAAIMTFAMQKTDDSLRFLDSQWSAHCDHFDRASFCKIWNCNEIATALHLEIATEICVYYIYIWEQMYISNIT